MSTRGPEQHRVRLDVLLVIALGGVIGATARYALSQAIPAPDSGFPISTLTTNVIGSFLLGFVAVLGVHRWASMRYFRPFVAIGVIGSFTTFSAFAVENVELVDRGEILVAVVYVPIMLSTGLAAARLGIGVGRRFNSATLA